MKSSDENLVFVSEREGVGIDIVDGSIAGMFKIDEVCKIGGLHRAG